MKLLEIHSGNQLEEIKELIKRDCQPFLKMVDGQTLYRGITTEGSSSVKMLGSNTLIGTVRKDRKPKDSSRDLHALLDSLFKEHFLIRARSEGLFASFTPESAGGYGTKFAIYPIGPKVIYLWSPILSDLYDTFEQSWGYSLNGPEKEFWEMVSEYSYHHAGDIDAADLHGQDRLNAIEWVIDQYHNKLFKTEIEPNMHGKYHGHEIMVVCDTYYGIEMNLFDQLEINEDDFMKELTQ